MDKHLIFWSENKPASLFSGMWNGVLDLPIYTQYINAAQRMLKAL